MRYKLIKDDLDIMYHPIPKEQACRIFIGQVPVCEVYHRVKEPTLFEKGYEKWEFHISPFKKVQPEGEWLNQIALEESQCTVDNMEKGIEWLLFKLNLK